jgi:mono/diheme cytochrome c family protein
MYIGSGDAGTGEQRDTRRLDPQRLDTLVGKILRIVPDLREHTATTTVSENGRYRIPSDNPFSSLEGARKEIWACGLRNPHRMIWDVDPARPGTPLLFAFNIGLATWETVVIVRKGANYGYPLREGPQMMSSDGMSAVPTEDTIPVQISDTVVRGTVKPTYPVIQYPHMAENGGDAIAGGFVYRGSKIPALRGSLVEETYHARGGRGEGIPGAAAVAGRGRVDFRFAVDNDGEPYILTKSDGMIRKVVAAKAMSLSASTPMAPGLRASQDVRNQDVTKLTNPVASTPESIAAGKKAYDANCAACHGALAQGAVKAGVSISIIEEQKGKQPPDLTDDQWDHGSSDGEIYAVIKKGLPPTMMAAWDGRIPDNDIWSIVNYIHALAPKK